MSKEQVEKFRSGQIMNGKFIGFETITSNPQDVVNDSACQILMNKMKKEQLTKKEHKPKIFIRINLEGIELVDEKSSKIIFKHSIQRILFISVDKSDPRSVGYVYKSDGNDFVYFALKTEKPAQELFNLLKELFGLIKESLMIQAAQQQQMLQFQQQQMMLMQQQQQQQHQSSAIVRKPSYSSVASSSRRASTGSLESSSQSTEIQEELNGLSFEDKPINCGKRLGTGSFGTVYTVEEKISEETVNVSKCVKLITALKIFVSESELKEVYFLMQEAKFLAEKSSKEDYCPNLLKYFGVFENNLNERLGILTEYFGSGNLQQIIEYLYVNNQYMPEEKSIKWTFQIIKALSYLHSLEIIHRDVKTRNIYIQNDSIKLGDLGLARSLETYQKSYLRSNKSTPNYMSPEMLSGRSYSFNTDVWSVGCVVYEMIKLIRAYDGQNFQEISTKIIDSEPPRLEASLIFKPLISAMLQKDPQKRPDSYVLLAKLGKLQAYFEEFKDYQ